MRGHLRGLGQHADGRECPDQLSPGGAGTTTDFIGQLPGTSTSCCLTLPGSQLSAEPDCVVATMRQPGLRRDPGGECAW